MKKVYVFIFIFLLFIILFTVIGSYVVTGSIAIDEEKDIFIVQSNKEVYFNVYGYTIDNPNIIINPYGNSPLTAIIMFETDNYSEVSVTIKSKNGNSDIIYTFDKDKYHLIPIYGLYSDYDNTVIIRSEGIEKNINIKTDELPVDFEYIHENNNKNFIFYNSNYPYAVDCDGEVRWYLNRSYYGNITLLDNSNIIIGSDKYTEDGDTISFYKMSLLGKIYNEYLLENGYYGYNSLYNDDILVLSDKIMHIDLQTGDVINKYDYIGDIDYITTEDGNILVRKDGVFYLLTDDSLVNLDYKCYNREFIFYNNTSNYNIIPSNRFGNLKETVVSNEKIPLINYKEIAEIENINITKETNRIKIVNNSNNNIFVIFDKFMDKRIYEISDVKYINTIGLNGKYTLYFEINGKLHKTNYYIEV